MRGVALTAILTEGAVRRLNWLLAVGLAGLLVAGIVLLRHPRWMVPHGPAAESAAVIVPEGLPKMARDAYASVLSRTPLFAVQIVTPVAVPSEEGISVDAAAKLAQYQLQGVVSGAQGLQAIIVDRGTNQTVYCQGGEQVGIFTVTGVEKNMVTMEYRGKQFELRF